MKDEDVFRGLQEIEKTIKGPKFEEWRKKFVDEHIDTFTYDDENKLEYTTIHKSYEAQIEQMVEESLPKDIAKADFEEALGTYLEGPGGTREETAKTVTLLLEVSDFEGFRDMMLFTKKERENKASGAGDAGNDIKIDGSGMFDIDGLMDMVANLSNNAATDEGWDQVLKNNWLDIQRKSVDKSVREHKDQIYMRGSIIFNLTYTELVDAFCYFGERRAQWDSNYKGHALPRGGNVIADDACVISSKIEFGALLHMMGIPRQLNTKFFRKWDHPTKGTVTTALVPWDIEKDCLNRKSSILTLKTMTLKPHPTDPGKSVVTTLEINRLGSLPKWVMNILCTLTAPQMMRSLEQRYISNIRNTGKGMDLTTPEARAKAAAAE
uniref:ADP-ribosylation factor-like protein 2-binding protein n=1 Tax=Hemiselmis andersenii TaxID=464988 RepID=A0A6U2CB16_HEMAN|mmetsp:Transcript_19877/g.45767  ORF Transcript_19877/g.45767 Transcript_19877/m.45767 type:complete len:380 (+) Transcript_19877:47-1186(+)